MRYALLLVCLPPCGLLAQGPPGSDIWIGALTVRDGSAPAEPRTPAEEQPSEPPKYVPRASCRYLKDKESLLIHLILENAGKEPRTCYFGDFYQIDIGNFRQQGVASHSMGGPRHVIEPKYGVIRSVVIGPEWRSWEGLMGTLMLKVTSWLTDEAMDRRIDLVADPIECQVEDSQ